MSVPVVPVALLLFLPGLYASAYLIDWVRFGEQPESEVVNALIIANRRLSPDDAPLWAEVLGVLLGLGLTARSGCHVAAAAAAGLDRELVDVDVTAGNTVAAVRDAEWQVDVGGRVVSVCAAVVLWPAVDPLTVSYGGPAWVVTGAQAFVIANIAVLASDPVLFLANRTRLNAGTQTHG